MFKLFLYFEMYIQR